jgi:hypothetical protein
MKIAGMRTLVLLLCSAMTGGVCIAATNDTLPLHTFAPGAILSSNELESVAALANSCGIKIVTEINTRRRGLDGFIIEVFGDQITQDRVITIKKLWVHRSGWDHTIRPAEAKIVADFSADKPELEERTIVQIGDRKVQIGLLNGIKPAGADKVVDAFASQRIRFANESLRRQWSLADVESPRWLGISDGHAWISFSQPLVRYVFKLNGDEVELLDILRSYE